MTRHLAAALLASLALLPAACSTEEEPGGECSADTIDAELECLGVPTDDSPRHDRRGDALPASYSPLGPSFTTGQNMELFAVGMRLAPEPPVGEPVPIDNRAAFVELTDDDTAVIGPTITDVVPPGTPWEADSHSPHPGFSSSSGGLRTTRAAVAADLDADGVDELLVAYVDLDDPAADGAVYLQIVGDPRAPSLLGVLPGARGVSAAAADFDGDGRSELAVGVVGESSAALWFVARAAGGELARVDSATRTFTPVLAGGEVGLELAAGNLDRDNGDELALVFNEYLGSPGPSASAAYFIYDDAGAGYVPLAENGLVRAVDGGSFVAVLADVAVGDIDADGKDEVVFAGVAGISTDSCDTVEHVYLALDDAGDAPEPLGVIGQHAYGFNYIPQGTGCDDVTDKLRVNFVHVNAFDVDGDGVDEIQANLRVFEDFAHAAPFTEVLAIPTSEMLLPGQTSGGTFTPASTAMVTGDINGDGREELIVFLQWRHQIDVWGLDGPSLETAVWRPVTQLATESYNGQSLVFPILVPCDIDSDGIALKYSDAEHKLVFTEPVLIAALAAAPCAEGIGQNTTACRTAYGLSESSEIGVDGTITVRAGAFVSGEGKLLGFGVEGRASLTVAASFSAGTSYSLEETVEYTTGPLEDTVIFTSVPLDQYTYTIVSHPDPALVGTQVVVNLPRSPVTLQTEREFYNRSVSPGSFQVGSNVFLHTVGNLDSYPTEGDAEALIMSGGLGHLGPLGELVDAAGEALGPIAEHLLGNGLKASRAVTVGEGTGQVSTEIRFSEQTTYRAGAEVSFDAELGVSAGGATVGATVGASVEGGVSWGSGSTTIYRGTIGSIDSEHFSDNLYSAGLFTYIYNYGNRDAPQLEVINYWVER